MFLKYHGFFDLLIIPESSLSVPSGLHVKARVFDP
jgi:hypothetical protein